MTFEIMHRGFKNGPTERYEFDVPLHRTQGPSWSRSILVELAPTFFQSVPRCRAVHPDHDCQCTQKLDHRGGWDSRHHCWHAKEWMAWRRGKRDLIRVPDKRILVAADGVSINPKTKEIFIGQTQVVTV